MGPISFLFWGLVVVTALVSLRWGAMIGLIGFVFALMIGAVVISHWASPRNGLSAVRHAAFARMVEDYFSPATGLEVSKFERRTPDR